MQAAVVNYASDVVRVRIVLARAAPTAYVHVERNPFQDFFHTEWLNSLFDVGWQPASREIHL